MFCPFSRTLITSLLLGLMVVPIPQGLDMRYGGQDTLESWLILTVLTDRGALIINVPQEHSNILSSVDVCKGPPHYLVWCLRSLQK